MHRYYNAKVRKSPHVVGHYAAGARLIGLTEKQMAQHLATLNQSGDENSDSPYAQPVCLFNSQGSLEKQSRKGKIRLRIINKKLKDSSDTEVRSAVGEKVQCVWFLLYSGNHQWNFVLYIYRLGILPCASRREAQRRQSLAARRQPPACLPCVCGLRSQSNYPPSP